MNNLELFVEKVTIIICYVGICFIVRGLILAIEQPINHAWRPGRGRKILEVL